MRVSRSFAPTRKEPQKDARTRGLEALVRAGYLRRTTKGTTVLLPLGARALGKLEARVVGALERSAALPIALPDTLGVDEAEAALLDVARSELRGYSELPRVWVQAVSRELEAPRSPFGLVGGGPERVVEAFVVAASEGDVRERLDALAESFLAVLSPTSLGAAKVLASPSGSSLAVHAHVAGLGDETTLHCRSCDARFTEDAAPKVAEPDAPGAEPYHAVDTPGRSTVDDVALFLGVAPKDVLKSMVVRARSELVLAVVRGDHAVSETRLARALGVPTVTLATPDEVMRATGAKVGFAGPVGFQGRVLLDPSAASDVPRVVGANAADTHLRGVRPGRDFAHEIKEIRAFGGGAPCPLCGAPLSAERAAAIARFDVLGQGPAAREGALFATRSGEKIPFSTGRATLRVSRALGLIAEAHSDAAGLCLPPAVAPFDVHVVSLGTAPELVGAAEAIVADLESRGLDVLWDDRDDRPGPKLAMAELVGCPVRLTLGARGLAEGVVEVVRRGALGETFRVPLGDVGSFVDRALAGDGSAEPLEHRE